MLMMMWTASPQRHHSAKAWSQERHKEGEAMGRAAGVWHHRRWMKLMVVPHAPLLVASFSAF
jgi:hypothetical protein